MCSPLIAAWRLAMSSGAGILGFVTHAALVGSAQSAQYFEVRFSVTETNTHRPGIVEKWNARCVVGPEKWLIENNCTRNARTTYFFDGTNVLKTVKITRKAEISEAARKIMERGPPSVLKALDREPSDSDWILLEITPGDLPLDNIGATLPWLAFCSGPYLRKPSRLLPVPGTNIRFTLGAFGFRDDTETFQDELGLPREISFVASAKLFSKAVRHPSLFRVGRRTDEIRGAVRAHSGVPDGFLKARYQVLTHTNLADSDVPTSFVYEEFQRRTNSNGSLARGAIGTVDSILISKDPTLTLSSSQRYSVSDYRFRHSYKTVDLIGYAITDGTIPPPTDPALRRIFEKEVAEAPYDPVMLAHVTIYVVFAVLLAGPVIAAGLWWLRRKPKMNRGKR